MASKQKQTDICWEVKPPTTSRAPVFTETVCLDYSDDNEYQLLGAENQLACIVDRDAYTVTKRYHSDSEESVVSYVLKEGIPKSPHMELNQDNQPNSEILHYIKYLMNPNDRVIEHKDGDYTSFFSSGKTLNSMTYENGQFDFNFEISRQNFSELSEAEQQTQIEEAFRTLKEAGIPCQTLSTQQLPSNQELIDLFRPPAKSVTR